MIASQKLLMVSDRFEGEGDKSSTFFRGYNVKSPQNEFYTHITGTPSPQLAKHRDQGKEKQAAEKELQSRTPIPPTDGCRAHIHIPFTLSWISL